MFITKVEAYLYKPLQHGGINRVEIDINAPVTCMIGQNGSGKSMLLSEIGVYPPTSTDYEKEGYRQIELTHEGDRYVLRSEFNGSKGTHLFIKNDVNLNLSENSTTQTSLCDSHFGTNDLFVRIASGGIRITDLRNTERKNVLAACYPSDLTFVLNHHRAVQSMIRDLNSNLKMLKTRVLTLNNDRMEDTEYNRLVILVDQLNEFRMVADRWVHTMQTEISEWEKHPAYVKYRGKSISIDHTDVISRCRNLHAKRVDYQLNKSHLIKVDAPSHIASLTTRESMIRSSLLELSDTGKDLAEEISKFEAVMDGNLDDELRHAEEELDDKITYRDSIIEIDDCPIIPQQQIRTIDMDKLSDMLNYIHSLGGEVWTSTKLDAHRQSIHALSYELKMRQSELYRITERRVELQKRHARHRAGQYNPKCALPCQLKSNFEDVLLELDTELNKLVAHEEDLSSRIVEMEGGLNRLQSAIEIPILGEDVVSKLERFFLVNPWTSYVLNGQEFIHALNHNSTSIFNRLNSVVQNSQQHYERVKLDEDIANLKSRVKLLRDSQVPAKELISNSLISKKVLLEQLTSRYEHAKNEHVRIQNELVEISEVVELSTDIVNIQQEFVEKANYLLVEGKLSLLKGMVSDLNAYRMVADEKQNELKATIRNQRDIRTVVDQEINPNINRLEAALTKLHHIESALSPNTGLPHVYMVRFLNSVIAAANAYIRLVWSYEMEILPLKESNRLDFILPVRFRKRGGVKDISMCSTAQKEIIDLAWTLALCKQMGLGKTLPMKLDEPDSGFTEHHRTKLTMLLSKLLHNGDIKQLFLINHHASLFTAFANSQIVCLDPEGIVLPSSFNTNVTIDR